MCAPKVIDHKQESHAECKAKRHYWSPARWWSNIESLRSDEIFKKEFLLVYKDFGVFQGF